MLDEFTCIDTLYMYGYIDISRSFYDDYVLSGKFSSLGLTQGYHWFLNNSNGDRVGVCEQIQADKMNSYPVVYQYSKKSCHSMTFDTYSSHISLSKCMIKRLDVAITFKKLDYKIYDTVISPFKSSAVFRGEKNEIETIYLGKRSTGKLVRHYNKSLELKVTNNYSDMDYYNSLFDTVDDLYTIECEITRQHIMKKFGNVTYSSISNLISYCLDTISLCVFFPPSEKNLNAYKDKNYSYIHDKISHYSEDVSYVSSYVPKKDKPSLSLLYDRTTRILDNYIKNVSLPDDELDLFYMNYFSSIITRFSHDTLLSSFEFDFKDDRESVSIRNDLYKKIDNIRSGQTDELYKEAFRAFKN